MSSSGVNMNCCPNCFSDNFLKNHISALSNKTGQCSFCKTRNVELLEPLELFDRFEPLLNLYETYYKGSSLIDLVQSDWNVFAIGQRRIQQKLLKAITDNKDLYKFKYRPKHLQDKTNIEQWGKFREELKHNNRFFPSNAPDREQLEPIGLYIGYVLKKGDHILYRARINNSDKPYEIDEMGKPSPLISTSGRANPFGIPYLYLSSTLETAISEVRGHKGEKVTIVEFHLEEDLELADLRDPKNTISPFELNDENDIELIYKNLPYLTLLGNELSKPIVPRDANLEYLPSQYLCELLKHIGFHGIIYGSSISDGDNFVIFQDKKLKPVSTSQYIITSVKYSSEKIK